MGALIASDAQSIWFLGCIYFGEVVLFMRSQMGELLRKYIGSAGRPVGSRNY